VPEDSEIWIRQRKNVIIMSTIISAAVLLGVYMGYAFPLTILPVIWIVPVVSNFVAPRMSIRRVSQILLGYLVSSSITSRFACMLISGIHGSHRGHHDPNHHVL
jgi:hypothetical protein